MGLNRNLKRSYQRVERNKPPRESAPTNTLDIPRPDAPTYQSYTEKWPSQ